MVRRSYGQFCGLAGALDLVGERWTLLVVRELMTGPKRYTDLADALPGIGTSLLADRLKRLDDDGICARSQLPPPAASTVYGLTEAGEELGRALVPLIQWGLRHAVPEQPGPDALVRPHWALLAFTHLVDPAALEGIEATYRFVVEGRTACLQLRGGEASVLLGDGDREPDATITLDATTVAAVGAGRATAMEAVLDGRIAVEGDPAAIDDLVRVFAEPADA